jgi:4-amino-4-deoxy-L-arabinose transferase-like glycosyltransferase
VYYLARELADDAWLARLAMWVLVSTQFFMRYATHAMTDVPFTFFFTLAILLYVKGLRRLPYLVLAGLPLACGLMTRSVIGLIPIGILLAHLVLTRRYDVVLSRQWFLLLALAFSFPVLWLAVEYRLYGVDFLRAHATFVLGQAYSGGPSSLGSEILQFLEYPKFLLQRYWPWLPFMALGFYRQSRAAIFRRDPAAVLLVLWVLLVVVPFSLAEVKYLRYILAAFPAFAILSASVLNEWIPPRHKLALFRVLYVLGAAFVVVSAVFPMTLLRATDMRQLAPVVEAHTPPQERVLLYTSGVSDWAVQNQLLWYGDRYTDLVTDLSEVRSRLESGSNTVVVINKEAAGGLRAALGGGQPGPTAVLAESENFVCLKYSPPTG